MLPEDRRKKILDLLKEKDNIPIEELSKVFKISIPTIYRDLEILESENNIRKFYGGIKLVEDFKFEHNFYKRLKINKKQKEAIARKAVEMISNRDTIVLDESSTTYYLAEELKKKDISITIITNSVLIPPEFINKKSMKLISTGGVLNQEIAGFIGGFTESAIVNLNAGKFFFSSAGISEKLGVMDAYIPENIRMKKLFLDISEEAICLIDSSKFKKRGTVNWVRYDNLRKIVTDEYLDKEKINVLNKKGVEVIIAKN